MLSQRKQRVRQLRLRQAEEEVGLVLGEIRRPLQNPALARGVILVDRVVSGGNRIRADGSRRLQQLVELQMVVAERAGNRRAPGEVLRHKRPHHILLEALLLVHHVVGNAEVLGHAPRVVHVVERAAAARLGRVGNPMLARQPRLIPELEREADNVRARSVCGRGLPQRWKSQLLRTWRRQWCGSEAYPDSIGILHSHPFRKSAKWTKHQRSSLINFYSRIIVIADAAGSRTIRDLPLKCNRLVACSLPPPILCKEAPCFHGFAGKRLAKVICSLNLAAESSQ